MPQYRLNADRWAESLGAVLPLILPRLNIESLQVLGFGSGAGVWLRSGLSCSPIFQSQTNILVDPQLMGAADKEIDCAVICMWSSREINITLRDVKHIFIDEAYFYIDSSTRFYLATESWVNRVIALLLSRPLSWVTTESLISFIEKNPLNYRDLSESRRSRLQTLISSVM